MYTVHCTVCTACTACSACTASTASTACHSMYSMQCMHSIQSMHIAQRAHHSDSSEDLMLENAPFLDLPPPRRRRAPPLTTAPRAEARTMTMWSRHPSWRHSQRWGGHLGYICMIGPKTGLLQPCPCSPGPRDDPEGGERPLQQRKHRGSPREVQGGNRCRLQHGSPLPTTTYGSPTNI